MHPMRPGTPTYRRRYRLADLARDLGVARGYRDLILDRVLIESPALADETARWLIDRDRRQHRPQLGRLPLPLPPVWLLLRLHRERMGGGYAHGVRLGRARATDRLLREATATCPVDPRAWTIVRPLSAARRDRASALPPMGKVPAAAVALPPALRDHAGAVRGGPGCRP